MTTTTMCEADNCTKRATIEWKAAIDHGDGPEAHNTYRCMLHGVSDPRYTATYLAFDLGNYQTPGQLHPIFMEALAPFMHPMYKQHEFSICCGAPVSDDGRCSECWEAA